MPENRKDPRQQVADPVSIVGGDGVLICDCTILDVSASGARLKLAIPAGAMEPTIPALFTLSLSKHVKVFRNCQMVWRKQGELGVQFVR